MKVLDLGCGQGNNTWFLLREGFQVVAVDGSESAVRKTTRRMVDEACNKYLSIGVFEFQKIPIKDQTFDVVIDVVSSCHNSIYELPDIYKEVARLLKPEGKFFLMCPTTGCSTEPFTQYGAVSFIDMTDLRLLLQEQFDIVDLLKSSYQLNSKLKVEHWVVSAIKNRGSHG